MSLPVELAAAGVPDLLVRHLLRLLIGGAVLLVVASLLARRSPAGAERQRLWGSALALLLLLPVLVAALPSIPVALPGLDRLVDLDTRLPAQGEAPATTELTTAVRAAEPEPSDSTRPQLLAVERTSTVSDPRKLGIGAAEAALLTWALGAIVLLASVLRARVSLHRLERRAARLTDPSWHADIDAVRSELGVERPVRVITDPAVRTPMTWGLRAPIIALPAAASTWSAQERRVVLLHELAHVARRDAPRLLAARLACILHWPDPLAWKALRRLAIEHELACDRVVLGHGVRPSSYARQLLSLARDRPTPRLSGALAMARRSSLEVRMLSILDPRPPAPGGGRRRSALALASLAVIAAGIAALTPASPVEAVARGPIGVALAPSSVASSRAGVAAQNPEGRDPESLAEVMAAARAVEAEMEAYQQRMREVEREMEAAQAPIEEIEAQLRPHHEALRRLELEQQRLAEPIRELELELRTARESRLGAVEERLAVAQRELELEREPLEKQLEELRAELERTLQSAREGIEEGREEPALERRIEELHARAEPIQRQLEELHRGLEPMHRELEAAVRELEPRHRELEEAMHALEPQHRQIEEVQRRMEAVHDELERAHRELEPFHRRMEQIHREMEPLHRRMEEVHRRLDRAVAAELRGVLAQGLGELDLSAAVLDRVAEEVRAAVNIRIDDDRLRLRASRAELRELLAAATGRTESHPAIAETVDALLDLDTQIQ